MIPLLGMPRTGSLFDLFPVTTPDQEVAKLTLFGSSFSLTSELSFSPWFIYFLYPLLEPPTVGKISTGGGGDERPFFVMRTFGGAYKKCPKPGLLKLRTFQTRLKNLRNLNWAGVVVEQASQKFEVQPARWWCWSRRQCLSRLSSHFRVGMWWSRWTCWTRSW